MPSLDTADTTLALSTIDESLHTGQRDPRRMAVFGIVFPTPNPSISVKASLPQTFLEIAAKQAERAQSV